MAFYTTEGASTSGLLAAVTNGPLDEGSRDKPWMVQVCPIMFYTGSPSHKALAAIVLDKRWLKDVKEFINFCTASAVFQNLILMQAGKRFAYGPPVYEVHTLLTATDYNHQNHQPASQNSEGNRMNQTGGRVDEVKDNVLIELTTTVLVMSKKPISTLSNHLFNKHKHVEKRYFQLLCLQCPVHHRFL
ncbi:uncharacterized protein LOC121907969 isoform X2 [Thunnus maccoyii]|uniref:uncharacterized protein LOC121907969 isoform X2 n=1 Tax=Thunnus maccoyii TaxID=8240 RepID=UPI001C4CA692|nr:uncharacterized protein LOC121907969 isoform X2 [Thunnus maccoyii]